MIRIEYDERAIRRRLIPFQLIPVLLVWYLLAAVTGLMTPKSPPVAFLVIAAGFGIYAVIMRHMLLTLKEPMLLSIDADRTLRWRPGFRTFEARLSPGSRVSVGEGEVAISPRVPSMPATRTEDARTVVKLPQGLRRFEHGEIILA